MKNFTQNLFFVALLLFGTTIFSQEPVEEDSMDLEELEEVLLIGGGVIDLAEDRKTPVAATTIKRDTVVIVVVGVLVVVIVVLESQNSRQNTSCIIGQSPIFC